MVCNRAGSNVQLSRPISLIRLLRRPLQAALPVGVLFVLLGLLAINAVGAARPAGDAPFRRNHRRRLAPAGTALRLAPERGERRRDWLRASPSARAENHLRASPAAQGKRQASPVGGVSPSFCSHAFNLIHPLFLAAPPFRLVELAGCGTGLLSCFLSGPGRLPHGLSAS
jgi:hypothetical protein